MTLRRRLPWPRSWPAALAAASLVACAAVAWIVWPRGGRTDAYFHRTAGGHYSIVQVYPGKVAFARSTGTASALGLLLHPQPPPVAWGHETGGAAGCPPAKSAWNRLGFWHWPSSMWIVQSTNEIVTYECWIVPTWLVVAAPALPAGAWAAARSPS